MSWLFYIFIIFINTFQGNNSIFSLALQDISNSFAIEPKVAKGRANAIIRITNNSLDYEDPNQRKLIILVIAKEVYTTQKLSSTATVTLTVTDVNDNAPTFEPNLYSETVSELASTGTVVIAVTASDRDSGKFGVDGIVYSLEGEGSDKFNIDPRSGVVTVASCPLPGTAACLDYESKHQYKILAKVS